MTRSTYTAEQLEEATRTISEICLEQNNNRGQRLEKMKTAQRTMGESLFVEAVRLVPIYDFRSGRLTTFDTAMRGMMQDLAGPGSDFTNTPMGRDPVGASMSIVFDSSMGNISSKMGIPWPPR